MHGRKEERDERGTALVCERGHLITTLLEYSSNRPGGHCEKCGAPTMHECKSCGGRILGGYPGFVGHDKTPPSNCTHCGKPFPWREEALAKAEKVARMQAEIYELDAATANELFDFTKAVAEDRASPEEASTFGQWFKRKAGPEAAKAVGGVLKDVATSTIADVIRKTMLGA